MQRLFGGGIWLGEAFKRGNTVAQGFPLLLVHFPVLNKSICSPCSCCRNLSMTHRECCNTPNGGRIPTVFFLELHPQSRCLCFSLLYQMTTPSLHPSELPCLPSQSFCLSSLVKCQVLEMTLNLAVTYLSSKTKEIHVDKWNAMDTIN